MSALINQLLANYFVENHPNPSIIKTPKEALEALQTIPAREKLPSTPVQPPEPFYGPPEETA